MATIDDLRKNLPNWPLTILDDWLLYFANEQDLGWPPPDPLGSHRWSDILGGRPLSWWHLVTWKKEAINCSVNDLCERSSALTLAIVDDIFRGTADETEKRRYKMPMQHLLEHGVFLHALVAMKTPSGLLALDGYHRLAALHGLQLMPASFFTQPNRTRPPIQQTAWIGSHRDGELPLR